MARQDSAIHEDHARPASSQDEDLDDAPHDDTSGAASPADDEGASTSQDKSSVPLQKRRRVTRACDECRRKKIKCDGKQPCTHCTVYSYDCTYDQPSNRRRNPVPAYVEALEARVHRAEGLIQMIAPNLDLNDPALDIAVRHGYIPGLKSAGAVPQQQDSSKAAIANPAPEHEECADIKHDSDMESMIRATGLLDVDENGNWDYHGHSSGLSFVRRMREQLGNIMGPDTGVTPFIKTRPATHILDSPRSNNVESPMNAVSPASDLPPEKEARELVESALTLHSALIRIVHLPSFWSSFDRIYALPIEQFTTADHRFFPLLYSALAVGTVYGGQESTNYEVAIEKGFKYFKAARHMMDIADIRDMASLQAIIFMILFLQSSARLSGCYSYIGVALRAAIRMGLHRSLREKQFNPLELEMRKRVFWTIRKLDVSIAAMLGLPQSLTDQDIDQDDPVEVDDEYISEKGIKAMPPGTVTAMTAFNQHSRLLKILNKIVYRVYPIHVATTKGSTPNLYTIPFSTIREIEKEMEEWKAELPDELKPSHNDPTMLRAQTSLRVTFAFNQILLYRPFLHFVAAEKRAEDYDQRAYACAASYINVSRNLIQLCGQLKKRNSINGSLWFTVYLTYFSILSLVYFAAQNPDNPKTPELMRDALAGKAILASATKGTMSADRCTATLNIIFSQLPEWMREGKPNPAPSKRKRKQTVDSRPLSGIQPSAIPRSILTPSHMEQPGGQSHADAMMGGTAPPVIKSEAGFTTQVPTFNSTSYTPPTEYSPTTQTLQQFGLQPSSDSTEYADLSSLIFSSAEPFSYPSQPPLTTFENNRNVKDPALYGNASLHNPATFPGVRSATGSSEHLDAQLYSAQPYMMQGVNWMGNMPGQGGTTNMTGTPMAGTHSPQDRFGMNQTAQPPGTSWPNQRQAMYGNSQPFQDIDLQEIFGSDWTSSMMTQGYGQ